MQNQIQIKNSTLDVQEKMYKRRVEEIEWNKGLSVQEILDKVNDPSKFVSRIRK
jgi:hypothetical protein